MIISPLLIIGFALVLVSFMIDNHRDMEAQHAYTAELKALEHRHKLDICDDNYRLPTTPTTSKAYSAHPAYKEAYEA